MSWTGMNCVYGYKIVRSTWIGVYVTDDGAENVYRTPEPLVCLCPYCHTKQHGADNCVNCGAPQ